MIEISETGNSVIIRVRVQPQAGRTRVVGVHDGALKVHIAAPAIEGQANEECIGLLSRCFGVRRSDVEITSGERSRMKLISIKGIGSQQILEKMEALVSR